MLYIFLLSFSFWNLLAKAFYYFRTIKHVFSFVNKFQRFTIIINQFHVIVLTVHPSDKVCHACTCFTSYSNEFFTWKNVLSGPSGIITLHNTRLCRLHYSYSFLQIKYLCVLHRWCDHVNKKFYYFYIHGVTFIFLQELWDILDGSVGDFHK